MGLQALIFFSGDFIPIPRTCLNHFSINTRIHILRAHLVVAIMFNYFTRLGLPKPQKETFAYKIKKQCPRSCYYLLFPCDFVKIGSSVFEYFGLRVGQVALNIKELKEDFQYTCASLPPYLAVTPNLLTQGSRALLYVKNTNNTSFFYVLSLKFILHNALKLRFFEVLASNVGKLCGFFCWFHM